MKTKIQRMALGMAMVISLWMPPAAHAQDVAETSASTDAATWTLGEIRKVDKSTGKLTIRHEDIKSLNMPAMTMVFIVSTEASLADLKVGDKVQFKAIQDKGKLTVTAIQAVQ